MLCDGRSRTQRHIEGLSQTMINTAYIRQNARESAAWDRPILAKKLEQCADEIERLRAQNEQLDAALKKAHDEIDRLTGYTDAMKLAD